MTWTRLDDGWTERAVFEDLPFPARWHYLAMLEMCSRKQLWDGRLRMADALRCSDAPDPAGAIDAAVTAGLARRDSAHLVLVEIDQHIPPPSVRAESERAKLRMRRLRAHKAGDHSLCLPGHCEHVPAEDDAPSPTDDRNVTNPVTRNTGTGRDGTGRALDDEDSQTFDVSSSLDVDELTDEDLAALRADGLAPDDLDRLRADGWATPSAPEHVAPPPDDGPPEFAHIRAAAAALGSTFSRRESERPAPVVPPAFEGGTGWDFDPGLYDA